jgi:hypothetical protein
VLRAAIATVTASWWWLRSGAEQESSSWPEALGERVAA